MTVLSFMFLFPAFVTEAIPNGQFNRDAYELYGIIASVMIFLAIIVSSLGTHSHIVRLRLPPPKRTIGLRTIFREIFETLANRSFDFALNRTLFYKNRTLPLILGISAAMLLAILYVPFLTRLFQVSALSAVDLGWCVLAGLVSVGWFEIWKALRIVRLSQKVDKG